MKILRMKILILVAIFFIIINPGNANINKNPVTYSCCMNYILDNGTLITGFENINDWTLISPNISRYDMQADTEHFKEGSQGLKLISHNGNVATADLNISFDFSQTKNFVFYTYIENKSSLQRIGIYFTSTTNWSKNKNAQIDPSYLHEGWNRLVIPTTNNSKNNWFTGKDDWNNTMIKLRLRVTSNINSDVNVTFDDLRYNMSGRAKAMFNFDDGTSSTDTIALPVLDANNQKGTTFVITNNVGNGSNGYMTLDQLKDLQNHGWDVSSHTKNHVHLTTLNDTTMTTEINGSYDWLVNNSFQKTASFFAYPYGEYNDIVLKKVEQRYSLARTTLNGRIQTHVNNTNDLYNDAYLMRWVPAPDNTSDATDMINYINETIDEGGLIILTYHNIINDSSEKTNFTTKALKQHIQKVSDYLKSRSSDIDVITYSDYVNANIDNFTPVINKTTRIYSNGTSILLIHNSYDEYMANMTIDPISGFDDVNILVWNLSEKAWVENSDIGSTIYRRIGDLSPDQNVSVNLDGNNTNYSSDNNGFLNLTFLGGNHAVDIISLGPVVTSTPTPTITITPIPTRKNKKKINTSAISPGIIPFDFDIVLIIILMATVGIYYIIKKRDEISKFK